MKRMRRGRTTKVVKKEGLRRHEVVWIKRAPYEIRVRVLRRWLESRERMKDVL